MSEYLPSFIVEPVLRQARRFSRLSGAEEVPSFLTTVPESFRTWTPSRFWNTSPPLLSAEDEQQQESTLQLIARNIQLWRNQVPSPPLEPMEASSGEDTVSANNVSVTQFPALDPQHGQQPRPVRLEDTRNDSETSLNPLRELPERSRIFSGTERGHSQSDPTTGARSRGQTITNASPIENNVSQQDDYRRRDGTGALPEDDGMGALRQRINAVWAGDGTPAEKSRLIHTLMTERYRLAQSRAALAAGHVSLMAPGRPPSPMSITSGTSQEAVYNLTPADLTQSFVPPQAEPSQPDDEERPEEDRKPQLGCVHYKRNVKKQCYECERWYTCRFCHDAVESHVLPRRQTKHMLCMICNTPQPVSQVCKMCGEIAGSYYCSICKLWSDDPSKSIYHCDDCGICRLGQGLGKDFFHCKTCAACMSISAEPTHKCIEKSTHSDCPICGDYLFTSNKSVAFMRCGHAIHETCFAEWCQSSYKCPICSKSVTNMESQFRRLDRHIAEQPMPQEYHDTQAYIFCNDCSRRSVTAYHWLGLKCEKCDSYNTAQLQLIDMSNQSQIERSHSHSVEQASAARLVPEMPALALTERSAESRRPSAAELRAMTRSPGARSQSPVVGSYFNTGPRSDQSRQATPLVVDENIDFWGVQSPTSPRPPEASAGGEGSSSSSDDEVMEDEEEGEDDADELEIFGHW